MLMARIKSLGLLCPGRFCSLRATRSGSGCGFFLPAASRVSLPLGALCFFALLFCWLGAVQAAENQTLTAAQVRARALEFLEEKLPWDPDTTDVSIEYDDKDLVLPAGNLELEFRLPASTLRAGRIPLSAQVRVDSAFHKRLRLNAHVTVQVQRIKTLRAVSRGEVLSEDDVEMETIQVNRIPRNAVTRLEDAVGFETVRNLGAGRVLTVNALRRPSLVDKGDQVILVAEKGLMKITAPGIVREKGFKDSLVQVFNVQTKKMVFGYVIDAKTVKVNF